MLGGKRKTIGVFVCRGFSMFDSAVYTALREEGERLGYDVLLFSTVGYHESRNEFDQQELLMFDFAPVEQLDGILMAPDSYEVPGFREKLRETIRSRAACPVVSIRHNSRTLSCTFTDENLALRPLIRHLIREHGLRDLAFLAGYPGHPDSEVRLQCFRDEMAEHHIPVQEDRIYYGTMWMNCGERCCDYYFGGPKEMWPEAVICANDYMAVGMMREMKARGIRVPEDVIVTGFDNVHGFEDELMTLTTVEQDFDGMTREAMRYLDRKIRLGEDFGTPERMGLPGKLVLGESCGCRRKDPEHYQRAGEENVKKLEFLNNREVSMSYFSIEANASNDIRELHEALVRKSEDTPELLDFYLCLFEKNRKGPHSGCYARRMTDSACLVHAQKDREDMGMPMLSFDRRRLLPPGIPDESRPVMLYVTLLHQRNEAYGYAVFRYREGSVPSSFFTHWNIILAGALQNIDKQAELRLLYEERRKSSMTDVLTRLLNRRGLEEQLQANWQHMQESGETVAFISVDLDGLKQINDNYGHSAGDQAIRLVARAISKSAPNRSMKARIGGDEYMIVSWKTNREETDRVIQKLDEQLKLLSRRAGCPYPVTASAGAVVMQLNAGITVEQCMQACDKAMYEIKKTHHDSR